MKICVTTEMTNHSVCIYMAVSESFMRSQTVNSKPMDCQGPPSTGFLKNLNIHLQTVKDMLSLG